MGLDGLDLDLRLLGHVLTRLLVAFALALPVGWERERSARSAGLRTFPLVAIASCSYVLLAVGVAGAEAEAQSRVLQGLMTGIGFIGGGAILKNRRSVTGTATAASLWATSAIGAAVAYGQLELALVATAITLAVLRLLRVAERQLGRDADEPDES